MVWRRTFCERLLNESQKLLDIIAVRMEFANALNYLFIELIKVAIIYATSRSPEVSVWFPLH